jgi:hypothetical protein
LQLGRGGPVREPVAYGGAVLGAEPDEQDIGAGQRSDGGAPTVLSKREATYHV